MNVWNPRISTCASCEGTFDGKPLYSCLLNREIGDDTLWLENLRMKEPARYEAERALYVNYRNPYYNYPKGVTADVDGFAYNPKPGLFYSPIAIVFSKDSGFVSEDYHKPEFVSNLSLDAYHMIPFVDYDYTTGSMVLCCRQYNTERKVQPISDVENSSLKAFPCPLISGQELTILCSFKNEGSIKMIIYNLLGQEVSCYSFGYAKSNGVYQYTIPLVLPQGIYMLKADNGTEQLSSKFSINN